MQPPPPPSSDARRVNMKGPDAKKKLLDESIKLIEERGLDALSFREVARRANVSHQAPYHHFGSREGILAAIVLEGFTQLDARLLEVLAQRREKSPADVLRLILRAYMTFAIENPVHFRVMFRPDLVPIRQYPEARIKAMLAFQRLVDAAGDCHPKTSRSDGRFIEVVNGLWAAAHGVATLLLDGPVRVNSPDIVFSSFIETAAALFGEAGAKTGLAG